MSHDTTAREIELRLRERLRPEHFELHDDSARHAGHPGAAEGGGHFRVVVVSQGFEGQTRLERHRTVHAALDDLMGRQIHALTLRTLTPGEWAK